jgi:5'(3')-deoxyribonucleotidase
LKTVFVDMDDVLCDFAGGVCKLLGMPRKELEARRTPGEWNIEHLFGLSQQEFWAIIRKEGGVKFWMDLEPTPHYIELLRAVNSRFKQWFILTSPDRDPRCYAGKIAWAQHHLGTLYSKVIPTPHKWVVSQKDRLLIDDREQNLIEFEVCLKTGVSRGGCGLMFPHNGNRLHSLKHDPLSYIEENLDAFNLQKRKRRIPKIGELI